MKFEVHKANGGGFFWRIVGGNGEIMASSQVYQAKQSAVHAVNVVKANAAQAVIYDHTT